MQKSYVSGTLNETRHLYYTEPGRWQVVEERVGTSASANRQFVWGLRYIDNLILRDRDTDENGSLDERLYGLQDANWNVTSIVDTLGSLQQRFNYDAYGLPEFLTSAFVTSTNSKEMEVLYGGYRLETSTTLFYVRHRVLNVTLGCWIQRDPMGYLDGTNLYELNSCMNSTDPTGLSTSCTEQDDTLELICDAVFLACKAAAALWAWKCFAGITALCAWPCFFGPAACAACWIALGLFCTVTYFEISTEGCDLAREACIFEGSKPARPSKGAPPNYPQIAINEFGNSSNHLLNRVS